MDKLIKQLYDVVAVIRPKLDLLEIKTANEEFYDMFKVRTQPYERSRFRFAQAYIEREMAEEYIDNTQLDKILFNLDEKEIYMFQSNSIIKGERKVKNFTYKYLDKENRVLLKTVQDVTSFCDKKEQQIQALQKELEKVRLANRAKSEFLSGMSHEIRTNLNVIINMMHFAKQDCDGTGMGNALEDLDKAERTSQYLLGFLNDILDISRIESGMMRLEPVVYSYREFQEDIRCRAEPLCQEKHISFKWEETRAMRDVFVDKVRLNQLLFNLLSNAVKYTPEGGTVTFSDKNHIVTDSEVSLDFTVTDTGIGMEDAFQEKMFRPFERETEVSGIQGTGLGLSIVREIVNLMEGTIAVKSKKGEGTSITVHLILPFATKEQAAEHRNQEAASFSEENYLAEKQILIAEDNVLNMEIITRVLQDKGAKVTKASNGKEAVARFEDSESGAFHAILMDVRMPVMDGLQAAKTIRKMNREDAGQIPIIAMTANAFSDEKRAAQEAGMTEYITKPVHTDRLCGILNRLLYEEKQNQV